MKNVNMKKVLFGEREITDVGMPRLLKKLAELRQIKDSDGCYGCQRWIDEIAGEINHRKNGSCENV